MHTAFFSQPPRASRLIGAALLMLGCNTMLGWFLHSPIMVEIVHGLVPMVFNTGLGLALTGTGLLFAERHEGVPRAAIGWFLMVLCGLTLAEHLFDARLGIDVAWLHQWYNYGNTRPGRMAPNTAIAFMLIGAVDVLTRRVESTTAAYTVVILTFSILSIGLTGAVGYMLAPDLLFGWARSARMAVHTASGIILAAVGLWTAWSRSSWFSTGRFISEAAKVRLLGTAILVVVTTTVGLTGFVLMQHSLAKSIETQLQAIIRTRGPWLMTMTQEMIMHARTELRLVNASQMAVPLLSPESSSRDHTQFKSATRRILAEEYWQIAVEDTQRRMILEAGRYEAPTQFVAALDNDGSELLWNGALMLRIRQAVMHNGKHIGYVRLDRSLQTLHQSLFDVTALGKTAELAICVKQSQMLVCLPNGQNAIVFKIDISRRSADTKLPMEYALNGKIGAIYAIDYRHQNVVAAYGPIAPGLGIVAKQDTVEAYAIIRNVLEYGVPVILLISILGALALYSQMDPLVSRMHASERQAEQSATEMRSLMHAVADGIMTIDGDSCIRSTNPAACTIFGYEDGELVGRKVLELIPAESRQAHEQGVKRAVAGGPPRLIGRPNVRVDGQRKDGSRFALELTITAVVVGTERHFVGIMRDVTQRQALEEKLKHLAQYDSLTGLANRNLFRDRLDIALKRSRRNRCSVALMFIDLDGFKSINDSLGHHAGDELLIEAARRMSSILRTTDTVARLGGDEFTVILEDMKPPAHSALAVANKVLSEMQRPFSIIGCTRCISASIGLVVHEADAAPMDIEELLRQADAHMYTAKKAGKNCVVGP